MGKGVGDVLIWFWTLSRGSQLGKN